MNKEIEKMIEEIKNVKIGVKIKQRVIKEIKYCKIRNVLIYIYY